MLILQIILLSEYEFDALVMRNLDQFKAMDEDPSEKQAIDLVQNHIPLFIGEEKYSVAEQFPVASKHQIALSSKRL